MDKKFYFIYKTTNLINGKIYVGKCVTLNPNWNYLGSGVAFLNAVNKYGKQNFKREILEFCSTPDCLCEREKFWIKELNSRDNDVGYNITEGGEDVTGFKHSKEYIKELSERNTGRRNNNYKYISKEIIEYSKFLYVEKLESLEDISNIIFEKFGVKYNYQKIERELKWESVITEELKHKRRSNTNRIVAAGKRNFSLSDKIIICPYCGKESFSKPNMLRYHFENCKYHGT